MRPYLLVSSSSRKIPLLRQIERQISQSKYDLDLLAGDSSARALSRWSGYPFWEMPETEQSHINEFLNSAHDLGVETIIPTRDGELEFYARNYSLFSSAGVGVMISPLKSIQICNDKYEFFIACQGLGLPVIETVLQRPSSQCAWPQLVVKERYGSGSRGVRALEIGDIGSLSLEQWRHPIFQPFIEGRELSIDAYRSNSGKFIGAVIRERTLIVDGEAKVSTIVNMKQASSLAEAVGEGLDLKGHYLLQVIESGEGLSILECNPRIGGASTLAMNAGLNSVSWFIQESLLGVEPQFVESSVPVGMRLVRSEEDRFEIADYTHNEGQFGKLVT